MKRKNLVLAFLAVWSVGSAWEAYSAEPISAKTHEFKDTKGKVVRVWQQCDAYHRVGGDCFFDFRVAGADGKAFWLRYKDSMANYDAIRTTLKKDMPVEVRYTNCQAGYCTPLAVSTPQNGVLVTAEESLRDRSAHKRRWTIVAAGFGLATLALFIFSGRRPTRASEGSDAPAS
jgi:hypothetical protein